MSLNKDISMRADLERIKKMIENHFNECAHSTLFPEYDCEIPILRELLISWQALTTSEYQTDAKMHLNMLTKRMLDPEPTDDPD